MVLHPKYDVLSALHATIILLLDKKATLEWVVSHQDDNTSFEANKAPIEVKLNIEADRLASEALTTAVENKVTRYLVKFNPRVQVQFHLKGKTITRDFRSVIRDTYHLLKLATYYNKKFK